MAAPQPNTNRATREKVELIPNVPVTLALKFAQGKVISGTYGDSVMYSTVDGRVLFASLELAAKIEALGVNVRENFVILKRTDGKKDSPVTWDVARPVTVGEQHDGTFAVPKLAEAPAVAKPMQRAAAATALVDEANALVDAFAAVLDRALTVHGGRVKPDEVRSIVLSAYIGQQRGRVA